MRLILRENVPNVGKIGDVVDVANGYGLNFLLPRRLALLANDRNVKQLDHLRRVTAVRLERARQEALGIADRLAGQTLFVVKHAGPEGKLYGSVTTREIADLLLDRGFEVDRRDIRLAESVRAVGEYSIAVELHQDVKVDVKLTVQASELSTAENAAASAANAAEQAAVVEDAESATPKVPEYDIENDPYLPDIDI